MDYVIVGYADAEVFLGSLVTSVYIFGKLNHGERREVRRVAKYQFNSAKTRLKLNAHKSSNKAVALGPYLLLF